MVILTMTIGQYLVVEAINVKKKIIIIQTVSKINLIKMTISVLKKSWT